ncbi:MAG: hypothetical protein QM774_07880 [Gordonia sp. (in: high G+C Gram-positive bacteria)]|uniref:hypothetical protein n=1 Tax=Gordonia sp. (in: high G+C Gram-positive bacteria) TaxID=84139 RepID=UPI0039E6EDAC
MTPRLVAAAVLAGAAVVSLSACSSHTDTTPTASTMPQTGAETPMFTINGQTPKNVDPAKTECSITGGVGYATNSEFSLQLRGDTPQTMKATLASLPPTDGVMSASLNTDADMGRADTQLVKLDDAAKTATFKVDGTAVATGTQGDSQLPFTTVFTCKLSG